MVRMTAERRAHLRAVAFPVVVLVAGLAALAGVLLTSAWHLWFWRDDWAFLRPVQGIGVWRTIVLNYNGHWSALPWLWFRAMRSLVGLRHYPPYAVAPVVLQIATLLLLYLLLRRAGLGRWSATIATLLTGALAVGVGAGNTLWLSTIGFLGACFFGLLGVLLADRSDRWRFAAPVALLCAVMCSNVGLILLVFAAAWALVRLGPLRAAAYVVGPLAIYVAWFLNYARIRPPVGSHRPWTGAPTINWAHGTHRMLAGLADLWSAATGIPGSGVALLVLLVLAVAAVWRQRPVAALGLGGLVALVFGFALFAFGKDSASTLPVQPRYQYVGVLVCGTAVGCLVHAVATYAGNRRWSHIAGGVAGAALVAAAGSVGIHHLTTAANTLRSSTSQLRDRVIATAWLDRLGERFLTPSVWPDLGINHGVNVPALKQLEPLLPVRRPSPQALLLTRGRTQVGVRTRRFDVPMTACAGHWTVAGEPLRIAAGVDGAQTRVRLGPGGGAVRTRLVTGDGTSPWLPWQLDTGSTSSTSPVASFGSAATDAGRPVYVATSAPDSTLEVMLPPGSTAYCSG